MTTRFFRAGVGTVIYRDKGTIAHFRRSVPPIGVWELQQGGIDSGENPDETLWRELQEEIGLTPDDFELITKMPDWTIYEGQDSVDSPRHDRLGQAHKWYFLRLKTERDIDITRATHAEVSEYTWTTFDTIIASAPEYKKHVYVKLKEFLETL